MWWWETHGLTYALPWRGGGAVQLDVLKQELRDMATLRHKNVLRVLGYGVFDAEPCVVSDFAALFGLR